MKVRPFIYHVTLFGGGVDQVLHFVTVVGGGGSTERYVTPNIMYMYSLIYNIIFIVMFIYSYLYICFIIHVYCLPT